MTDTQFSKAAIAAFVLLVPLHALALDGEDRLTGSSSSSHAAPSAAAPLAAPPVPTPLTLAWCLERARAANPGLESGAALVSAAKHRIDSAGALEDPRFGYEASNLPTGDFDFRSTPLSGHQFGLHQKLPFPSLLSKRRNAARRASEASSLLYEDQQLRVDGAVESAWAELGFAQQARVLTIRNIELLRQLTATAEARYRVGSGLQQDVFRAQVELTALLQEQLRREEAIERAESSLVEILDLPALTHLPVIADLSIETQPALLKPLLTGLDARSARLRAGQKAVDEARLRVRAAELEGYPDLDLSLGYRVRERVAGDPVRGDDFISAGFTFRLPVNRTKWQARVAAQRSLVRHAEARLRVQKAALASRTRKAHAELVRASSEEALMETGLVPQARQSLASSRSGYEVGRIDFLSLLDSQVRLLDAELRLARAHADKRRAFTVLESAAGEKLR